MSMPYYGVIGYPMGHSMSPFIHRRLFELSGMGVRYDVISAPPEELRPSLTFLLEQMRGLNVTIPHKRTVPLHLDRLEGMAALTQTVNTVAVERTSGKAETVGYNTDGQGFRAALEAAEMPLCGRVLLLGGGGAARILAAECALAGCHVINAVREHGLPAAFEMRADIRVMADGARIPRAPYDIVALPGLEASPLLAQPVDLLINATPVGMHPHGGESPVSDGVLRRCAAVFDAVYNPRHTVLLRRAAALGLRRAEGMLMLVWQAVAAHAIWYGGAFDRGAVEGIVGEANRHLGSLFG